MSQPSDASAAPAHDATPMMQQYRRLKAEAGDAVLFFRLGDFYEMFHDDAILASKLLEITLTARGREHGDGGVPMCGVPHHAAEGHVARLVSAGHKVAICDQVEDPKLAKGPVRRAIVRIVTPGTTSDERMLAPSRQSYLTAVLAEKGRVGLAHVDVSTGEFMFSEFDPESERSEIASELAAIAPREVLVCEEAPGWLGAVLPATARAAVTALDATEFDRAPARDRIATRWGPGALGAFGLESRPGALRAVGAALAYLQHVLRADLSHLEEPRLRDAGEAVGLDASTRRNLEITESLAGTGSDTTLAGVLDRTATPMGARTLRAWLLSPLRAPDAASARHDAVAELIALEQEGAGFLPRLQGTGDLERLIARVVMGTASPRDVAAIGTVLTRVPDLVRALAACRTGLLREAGARCDGLPEIREAIATTLVDDPPAITRDGGMIREGMSPELDEMRSLARDARVHLSALEAREREATGIGSLKVRHNKVFGYYLEVSQANLDRVPESWQRRQTLANAERFATPELKDLEQRIVHAQDRALVLEADLFERLRARVAEHAGSLRGTARALGRVDALASFASVALAHDYCRPAMDSSRALAIRGGRHPVVERMRLERTTVEFGDGRFVPNDCELDGDERQIFILTGPNMGGKSTYLRQVALITLMAQAGSFVPATEARVGVVDRIFTRVGASDSLATGQSTFMVEMSETARILHEATAASLVVLDEIGRGTSTFDGLSIAWAVAEHLHETPRVAARTLFATHYHELTELATLYPRVHNLRMATREWKGDIVFLHRVEQGAGDRSYGIQVARLAGLPAPVIDRAREVLENLMKAELDPSGEPRLARHAGPSRVAGGRAPQLPLFGEPAEDPRLRELCEEIARLDVDGLSPRAALDQLAELRRRARGTIEG